MEIQTEDLKVSIIQQNKANPCDFIFNKDDSLQNLNQPVQKIGQSQNLYLGGVETLIAQEISKHKIGAVLTIMTDKQKKKSKLQKKMQYLDDINRHITLMCDQDTLLAPYYQSAIQFINDSFKYKMNVLVHCKDGDSKSATLVMAYLIYKYKTEFQQAYNIVKARRPMVNVKEAYMIELKQSGKKLRSMS